MKIKDIKRKSIEAFSATINLGLNRGYSDVIIDNVAIYKVIQDFQNKLIEEKEIYLSLSASECDIVMSGQIEPLNTM